MAKRRRPAVTRQLAARGVGASLSGAHAAAAWNDPAMPGWFPAAGSADADLLADLETLTPRSRDLARNNGLAAGGMQTLKDCIVGAQLRLSAKPDYRLLGWTPDQARDWGNLTEAKFRSWAETNECDAANELNLLGLTLQALGGAMLNGDHFALPLWLPSRDRKWATRLSLIESDRVSTPPQYRADADVRAGIRRDFYGAPVGYYISKRHPGDLYGFGGFTPAVGAEDWDYVEAATQWGRKRVIHLHDKERTGQSRGKPIVTAVMREFHMAGKYQNTELQASVANSLIAAFLESDLSPDAAAQLFGDDPRAAWGESLKQARNIRELKGAAVIPLPAGAKLSSFTPSRPNAAFEAFMHAVLRHIAAGMNLPYELLLKDFSQTNYSSARATLLEAWRYFNGRRRWLMDTWLRPIYDLWLEEAVNAGEIDAPDFYRNRYAYTRCRFIFSGRGWVDPVKEATASGIRMDYNISTLEDECAEQGADWEEVIEQRAYERRRMAAAGLPLETRAASPEAAAPDSDADRSDPEEGDDLDDKAFIEAYGVAVRSGVITPQLDDEAAIRARLGLHAPNESVQRAWREDGNVRRPITLRDPAAKTGSAPKETEAEE